MEPSSLTQMPTLRHFPPPNSGGSQRCSVYVPQMREAIAHQAGLSEDAFAIHVDVVLPGKFYELQERAKQLRSEAETANAAAAEASRAAARTLASEGMSLRDIGTAMGVSFQRAQQLVGG